MSKTPDKQQKSESAPLLEAARLMKVLSHPLRLSILCNLIHNGEMTAGELVEAEVPHFSQSQVSQYLAILREMGYVRTQREGQVIRYSIHDRDVKKLVETLYSIYCT